MSVVITSPLWRKYRRSLLAGLIAVNEMPEHARFSAEDEDWCEIVDALVLYEEEAARDWLASIERAQQRAQKKNAVEICAQYPNMELAHTGGNCTAYRHPTDDHGGYLLITADDEGCAPQADDTEVTVARYDKNGALSLEYEAGKLIPVSQLERWIDVQLGFEEPHARAFLRMPISVDLASARRWLSALVDNGCDFHLEDDPYDIYAGTERLFTDEEAEIVRCRQQSLYSFEWGEHVCPIGYMLSLCEARDRNDKYVASR